MLRYIPVHVPAAEGNVHPCNRFQYRQRYRMLCRLLRQPSIQSLDQFALQLRLNHGSTRTPNVNRFVKPRI